MEDEIDLLQTLAKYKKLSKLHLRTLGINPSRVAGYEKANLLFKYVGKRVLTNFDEDTWLTITHKQLLEL